MNYTFARINLSKTNYTESVDWNYIKVFEPDIVNELLNIYKTYCIYKNFASVMPMFPSRFTDPTTDVIGYYDRNRLVAFSLIKRYDNKNAECEQFAWTYHNPKMRLGIESMKTECAIYRHRGFDYLYLEQSQPYKREIDGFELLGPMT